MENKPIRVLHIVSVMNRGGIENFLMNIYRKIDRTKVQFDFLVTREEVGTFDEEIKLLGGKIFNIPHIKKVGPIKYKMNVEHFFKNHLEYRIVHCHMNTWSGLFLPIAKRCGIPVRIAHSHTAQSGYCSNNIIERVELFFKDRMKRCIKDYATHFFSCSYDAGVWLFGQKIADSKMVIIKNGIDTEKFRYNEEIAGKVRKKLLIPKDALVIGHVGNMNSVKNHKFLIDVYEEIHRRIPNSVLCLVGDGKLRPNIEEQIRLKGLENNIKLLGTRSDVHDLLKAFDVFVMPSLFEGLSVALVEAQAASLPCVVSDTISREVDMGMGLVDFISLDKPPEFWADMILKKKNTSRNISIDKLVVLGYDSQVTADLLSKFYIDKYNNIYNSYFDIDNE